MTAQRVCLGESCHRPEASRMVRSPPQRAVGAIAGEQEAAERRRADIARIARRVRRVRGDRQAMSIPYGQHRSLVPTGEIFMFGLQADAQQWPTIQCAAPRHVPQAQARILQSPLAVNPPGRRVQSCDRGFHAIQIPLAIARRATDAAVGDDQGALGIELQVMRLDATTGPGRQFLRKLQRRERRCNRGHRADRFRRSAAGGRWRWQWHGR